MASKVKYCEFDDWYTTSEGGDLDQDPGGHQIYVPVSYEYDYLEVIFLNELDPSQDFEKSSFHGVVSFGEVFGHEGIFHVVARLCDQSDKEDVADTCRCMYKGTLQIPLTTGK